MTDLLSRPDAPEGLGPHWPPDDPRSSLVLVANRGPLRFSRPAGHEIAGRNPGGLVTALESLVRIVDGNVRWICAPATETDRAIARANRWIPFGTGSKSCDVRMLDVDPVAYRDFYGTIANPLLWFVQHGLYDDTATPVGDRQLRAWRDGYVEVNRNFASALEQNAIAPRDSVVWIHDYHFYLVPGMLRPARPDLFIHHFTHIPWPRPEAWSALRPAMTDAIFRGLLGSDIIGFQTAEHVENFLAGCEQLLGLPVDFDRASVWFEGRRVAVRSYPISIDVPAIRTLASSAPVAERARDIGARRSEKLILRVDRADPAKNIVRGFDAFGRMLADHPELHGRVRFLALVQPTRGEVPEYRQYMTDIRAIVDAVNRKFGRGRWRPIDLRLIDDLPLAVAAYKEFDVLMVNSVADGMNLVVKEALVANATAGAVVLSERAGAHHELAHVVVGVDPFDIEGQARALYEALVMPEDVRRDRLRVARAILGINDLDRWLQDQLRDIATARAAFASR